MKKLLYIFDQNDWQSRLPLAEAARAKGFDVTLALIGPQDQPVSAAGDFKIMHIKSPPKISPVRLLGMVYALRKIIGAVKPDIVHAVTLKYAFIAGLATEGRRDIRRVYTLAGLGYLLRGDTARAIFLLNALTPLLRHLLKAPGVTLIFQNPDDLKLMAEAGFAEPTRAVLVPGSGVDLARFAPAPAPETGPPLVLMPTRLVHEKGVHVFVEAARILRLRGVAALFQIAGSETAHNPRAIPRAEMENLTRDGTVQWLGRVEDMPALLKKAALVVYPSYYGEGIPRVLLEACAAGRAIVTTDHPGCREAVIHNENGLLVPVRDPAATADAIENLLADAPLRRTMGARSRALAQSRFDLQKITEQTLAVYG